MYSAKPPSAERPATAMFGQTACCERVHQKHVPHVRTLLTTTRSPTDQSSTPSPAPSITPLISCPITRGADLPESGVR